MTLDVGIDASCDNVTPDDFDFFQRDVGLQSKVFFWMMEILDDQPKGKQDYDHWISDGVVIGKGKLSCFH